MPITNYERYYREPMSKEEENFYDDFLSAALKFEHGHMGLSKKESKRVLERILGVFSGSLRTDPSVMSFNANDDATQGMP